MNIWIYLSACVVSYLIGSIPIGLIVARRYGVDIRTKGSGNIGATNVWRTLGKKAGLSVLLFDVGKGFIASRIGIVLGVYAFGSSEDYFIYGIGTGICAVIGHSSSIFLNMKGGKSVATTLGVLFGATPFIAIVALVIFLFVLSISQVVSLASLLAAIFSVFFTAALGYPPTVQVAYLFIAGFLVFRHRSNIRRILNGSEPRFDPTGQLVKNKEIYKKPHE